MVMIQAIVQKEASTSTAAPDNKAGIYFFEVKMATFIEMYVSAHMNNSFS